MQHTMIARMVSGSPSGRSVMQLPSQLKNQQAVCSFSCCRSAMKIEQQ